MAASDDNRTSSELVETLEELNKRFADALVPLAAVIGIFALFGIIGNSIVIAVFSSNQAYRKTNYKVFVIFLAVLDLLSCATVMAWEVVKTRQYYTISSLECKVKCFFNQLTVTISAFTLLVICVDRYRKVNQPLKPQMQPGFVIKILILVVIGSILFAIPAPILCGTASQNMSNIYNTTTTIYLCSAERRYHDNVWRFVYKYGGAVLLSVVSLAYVILYAKILQTVQRHWERRKQRSVVGYIPSGFGGGLKSFGLDSDNVSKASMDVSSSTVDIYSISADVKDNTATSIKRNIQEKADDTSNDTESSSAKTGRNNSNENGDLHKNDSDPPSKTATFKRKSRNASMTRRFPVKTMIWVILTLIFIVTYYLYVILSFWSTRQYLMSPHGLVVYTIFYRLYFVNNIVNPVVYAALDSRFKIPCMCRNGKK